MKTQSSNTASTSTSKEFRPKGRNDQPSPRHNVALRGSPVKRWTEQYKRMIGTTRRLPVELRSAIALFTHPLQREAK